MSNLHKIFRDFSTNDSKKRSVNCQDIRNKTAIKANFHFSHYKSIETLKLP